MGCGVEGASADGAEDVCAEGPLMLLLERETSLPQVRLQSSKGVTWSRGSPVKLEGGHLVEKRFRFVGRGSARAEDAQGTATQSQNKHQEYFSHGGWLRVEG